MLFYKKMASVYEHVFPSGGKPDFLAKQFSSGSKLLDVGCSDGRVAKALVEKGFDVQGIDLSPEMVQVAKKVSEGIPHFDISQMNMMDISQHFENKFFDGIYCIGNTLVHLTDKMDLKRTLMGFRQVLSDSGKFVLQIIHYDHVFEKHVEELPLIENEFVRFERYYRLKSPLVGFRATLLLKSTGEVYESEVTLVGLKKAELEDLLNESGFNNVEWFGDYKGNPLTPDSLQLVAVCKTL